MVYGLCFVSIMFPLIKKCDTVYVFTILTSPLLAGIPCQDVTVEDSNVVKCVTGPQPPRSTYYPGMDVTRKEWVIGYTSDIARK